MKKIKFMTIDLFVPKDVFMPRPETELLVNVTLYALRVMGADRRPSSILDIGCGSGNIAISLTKLNPQCKLITLDIDGQALEIAKTNAHLNDVSDRIEFIQSDLFSALPRKAQESFDIIVTNPPYVAGWEISTLEDSVKAEPRGAIDGGADGLDFYRKITSEAAAYLKPNGWLVAEIGYNQSLYISKLLEQSGKFTDFEIFKDDAGTDRVIMARLSRHCEAP